MEQESSVKGREVFAIYIGWFLQLHVELLLFYKWTW